MERAESSFALVRPPGHHAEPVRARGFCLFNNVAVAAAHAQAALGRQRVMIIDWDAHHRNGTQDIFWANPDVLFFDIHLATRPLARYGHRVPGCRAVFPLGSASDTATRPVNGG